MTKNAGFYKTNIKVLQFDVNKEIDEIRFNHYIERKENFTRISKQLELGNFELSVRVVATDLNVSFSKAQRLIKKFIDLGIIELVYKSTKKDVPSIYRYATYTKSDTNSDTKSDTNSDTNSDTGKPSKIKDSEGVGDTNSDSNSDTNSDTNVDTSKIDTKKENEKENEKENTNNSLESLSIFFKISCEEYYNKKCNYSINTIGNKIEESFNILGLNINSKEDVEYYETNVLKDIFKKYDKLGYSKKKGYEIFIPTRLTVEWLIRNIINNVPSNPKEYSNSLTGKVGTVPMEHQDWMDEVREFTEDEWEEVY